MAPVKGCCDFCGRPSNDVLYGPIHRMKDIKCHYYCLLFSSNLDQNGTDDEGILGFLLPDIKKEIRRAKTVYCSYCRKPGGVSSCHASKCKKKFHLPCGLERGSLHLFYDNFKSFCGEHRRKQRVPAEILNSRDVTCSICFDPIWDLTSNDSIWAPCCKKNSWFHRICIQKFALNAAYFFKCPLCASQDKFRDAMLRNGIYIPDQDASWELEPNAFAELLERHNQCDAASCKCPRGRRFSSEGSRFWNIILCRNCASKGIHVGCIPGPKSSLDRRSVWDCSDCQVVIQGKRNSQGQDGEVNTICHAEKDDEDEIIVVDDEEEECDIACDKARDVSNIGLRNADIRQILSNVIHLKSTAVDVIDLVNDENEGIEDKIKDDDEMYAMLDESGTVLEDPSIRELTEESSLDYRNEVGKEIPLHSPKPHRITTGKLSSRRWQKLYSRRTERYYSRKLRRRSPFSHYCDSITVLHSNCSIYPSHYIGLKSTSNNLKSCHYYGNGSNCLKCLQLMEDKAGKLFDSVLVDGWCEILRHLPMPFNNRDGLFCKDMYKLLWVRTSKWVCGLTSFLSALKQSSFKNRHDLTDTNPMLLSKMGSTKVFDLRNMNTDQPEYVSSYPEITVQFLN